jgi:DNA-binding NarL/FixJ family response regulator
MSSENQIKIAIADDHKIFRDGIKMALSDKLDLKMLWEAEDGKDMMHKISIKMPDVLLMDIRMPEIDGINAIQIIRKEYEEIKIIVLTMYDDQQMISKMMEMGANAYLTKTTDPEEIYEAILTCMNDDFYFNELVNKAVMGRLLSLIHISEPTRLM